MTSRDVGFRVPPFPLPARLALAGWRSATRLGLSRPGLDEKELIAVARKRTGLHDFGSEDFRPALGRLLYALEGEANLHLLGRAVLRNTIIRALECRLRLERLAERHPGLSETPVSAPVFITGMQRTGTTKLHRLLSCAPELRPLSAAEGLCPVLEGPPIRHDAVAEKKRLALARTAERGMKYMAPELFAIHPIEADAPEEDVFLFDLSFVSPAVDASLDVPSYAKWIREIDPVPPYRYVRRLIQLLLWQKPGRYLGKTPHHQENLDALFEVFPDARVIHTHRDPKHVVPSFSSMMAHAGAMLTRELDPNQVGRRVVDQMVNSVERAISARAQTPANSILDVYYEDLVDRPLDQMQKIYDFIGLEWSAEGESRMQKWIKGNPQHKYGTHRYELSDFGLDEDEIDARFKHYREHFNVPKSRTGEHA
jgi:hypothetical protein